jgi:P27 family predicted phage terminase small subunit
MGRHGPPREPAALRIHKGETRPSQVNYLEPVPRWSRPVMPADMDARAKAVWRRVMREMAPADVIRGADTDVLRCFCEAVADYAEARRQLHATGLLVMREGQLAKNPMCQVVRDNRDAIRSFARELGLSPAARASLQVDTGGRGSAMDIDDEIGPPTRQRFLAVVGGTGADE